MCLQVKIAYVNFVNHCYVDTEVEMKEIYTSNHIWKLFEDFTVDMARVKTTTDRPTTSSTQQVQIQEACFIYIHRTAKSTITERSSASVQYSFQGRFLTG